MHWVGGKEKEREMERNTVQGSFWISERMADNKYINKIALLIRKYREKHSK